MHSSNYLQAWSRNMLDLLENHRVQRYSGYKLQKSLQERGFFVPDGMQEVYPMIFYRVQIEQLSGTKMMNKTSRL